MHFLAIWQRRYLLTFREQEREAVQNILLLFQLQCSWSVLSKKKWTKKSNIFSGISKIQVELWYICPQTSLQHDYVDAAWSVCLRWIRSRRCFSRTSPLLHQDHRFNESSYSGEQEWLPCLEHIVIHRFKEKMLWVKKRSFHIYNTQRPKQRPPATKCIVLKWFVTFEPLILSIPSNK